MSVEERLRINGKLPKSRLVSASGCRITSLETVLNYSAWKDGFGIFTTKSIGPEPRHGNHSPIYCADPDKGVRARRNAVGLANPGHAYFRKELERLRASSPELNGSLLMGSVFGSDLDEITDVCVSISDHVDAIEINFSCPHAKGYGFDTGTDADAMAAIVRAVSTITGRDIFPKLSPNLPDDELAAIARSCVDAGARGVTVINTVTPAETCLPGTGSPVLFNRVGGGSGSHILERGLDCVGIVRDAVGPDPLIIGMGGVYTGSDARQYIEAGADFVGLGTVMEFMSSELLRQYVFRMNFDIDNDADTAERLLPSCSTIHYEPFTISDIDERSDSMRVFTLDRGLRSGPAQYVFLAVPADDERPTMEAPFSVPVDDPLTLAVRRYPRNGRKDHFTSRLWELEQGGRVFVRGPYGVPFGSDPNGRLVLVGGGTGVAALASIARDYRNHLAFIGAKTAGEILFFNEFKKGRVVPVTEDEIVAVDGYCHGLVTDVFRARAFHKDGCMGRVVTCGPLPMMERVVEIAMRKGFPAEDIFAVMEPYMKCGVGICGSCSQYDGSIACTDGHILDGKRFRQALEERKLKRDATGAWDHG